MDAFNFFNQNKDYRTDLADRIKNSPKEDRKRILDRARTIEQYQYEEEKARKKAHFDRIKIIRNKPEQEIREPLFRSINIGSLFMLWRDKILPLKVFQGGIDSDQAPNTITSFWFKHPILFSNSDVLIELLSPSPGEKPIKGKEGVMRFSKDFGSENQTADGEYIWEEDVRNYEIDEVYISQYGIPLNRISAKLSERFKERLAKYRQGVDDFINNLYFPEMGVGSAKESIDIAIQNLDDRGNWKAWKDSVGTAFRRDAFHGFNLPKAYSGAYLLCKILYEEFGDSIDKEIGFCLWDSPMVGRPSLQSIEVLLRNRPLLVLRRLKLLGDFLEWLDSLPTVKDEYDDESIINYAREVPKLEE